MTEAEEEANNVTVDMFSPQRNNIVNLINEVVNLTINDTRNNLINEVANLTIDNIRKYNQRVANLTIKDVRNDSNVETAGDAQV